MLVYSLWRTCTQIKNVGESNFGDLTLLSKEIRLLTWISLAREGYIFIYKNFSPSSIVSAETDAGGQVSAILEETVKVLVGEDEEEQDPTLSKPGVRRAKLQATLRAEMGRQREVEWTKRQQEQRLYEEEIYEG